ncbi:Bro-N domain-containing protein [archaeon]|jgi:DNA-damage-inducible protein D|nr:Bro-N domain-containing protein [archaeon]MBT7129081.1 Bro-N domain-containing protein [archaeon]
MVRDVLIFGDREVRRVLKDGEWFFSVVDVVGALVESRDIKQYVNKMRQRDEFLKEGWVQIVHPLLIKTAGGEQAVNCANKKGIFRIIQSIPSRKAEPFKLWLAKVGSERIDEIGNPELAQERMKRLYEEKGYSKGWIDKRLRGISVRQDLTDEWKTRGVDKNSDFAILTAEISKATFDMYPSEYKKFKGLEKENLRDHMTDLELIFSMLGEASTAELERVRDPKDFEEHRDVAIEGGSVAMVARQDLERKSGERVVNSDNYLGKDEKSVEKRKRDKLVGVGYE